MIIETSIGQNLSPVFHKSGRAEGWEGTCDGATSKWNACLAEEEPRTRYSAGEQKV